MDSAAAYLYTVIPLKFEALSGVRKLMMTVSIRKTRLLGRLMASKAGCLTRSGELQATSRTPPHWLAATPSVCPAMCAILLHHDGDLSPLSLSGQMSS